MQRLAILGHGLVLDFGTLEYLIATVILQLHKTRWSNLRETRNAIQPGTESDGVFRNAPCSNETNHSRMPTLANEESLVVWLSPVASANIHSVGKANPPVRMLVQSYYHTIDHFVM